LEANPIVITFHFKRRRVSSGANLSTTFYKLRFTRSADKRANQIGRVGVIGKMIYEDGRLNSRKTCRGIKSQLNIFCSGDDKKCCLKKCTKRLGKIRETAKILLQRFSTELM
jgi:hypothetical protein